MILALLACKVFINLSTGNDKLNGTQMLFERNMLIIDAYISKDLSEKVTIFILLTEILFLNF